MRLSVFFAIVLLAPSACLAEDCLRNQGRVLNIIPGQDGTGEVKFTFESRREQFDRTNSKYVWCIEADKDNPNIAEFKWGVDSDPCRYLCNYIEPGRGTPAVKFDGSKNAELDRSIMYTRKNREEWKMHRARTVSSRTIGSAFQRAVVWPIQFTPGEKLSQFADDEGVIQIDRLSANRDALLTLLRQEKEVFAGGTLTVTLPRSPAIANLLKANAYEKYDAADFVRAKTSLVSSLSYNDGSPTLIYRVMLMPEDSDSSKVASLLSQGYVEVGISPRADSWYFPFPAKKLFPFSKPGAIDLGKKALDGLVSYSAANVEVLVGGVNVASFDVSLFAPKP